MFRFEDGRYVFAPLEGIKTIPKEEVRFPDGLLICPTPEIIEWNIGLKCFFSMPITARAPHVIRLVCFQLEYSFLHLIENRDTHSINHT